MNNACCFCKYDACDICVHGKEMEKAKREAVERLAELFGIHAASPAPELPDQEVIGDDC